MVHLIDLTKIEVKNDRPSLTMDIRQIPVIPQETCYKDYLEVLVFLWVLFVCNSPIQDTTQHQKTESITMSHRRFYIYLVWLRRSHYFWEETQKKKMMMSGCQLVC